jgi:hypothetical protein
MYLFRSRDRRLMEQTERDVALTLQRDYFSFSGKKTTEMSNKVPIYTGYLSTGVNLYPNIFWIPGTQVDAAFSTLEQLLTQLSQGSYQASPPANQANPGIWPVATISSPTEGWQWLRSLYAYSNPAYADWLTTNGIPYPSWV